MSLAVIHSRTLHALEAAEVTIQRAMSVAVEFSPAAASTLEVVIAAIGTSLSSSVRP